MAKKLRKFHHLRRILTKHRDLTRQRFHQKHRHIKRILKKHSIKIEEVRRHGAKLAATGAIAGTLMTTAAGAQPSKAKAVEDNKDKDDTSQTAAADEKRKVEVQKKFLAKFINKYGPKDVAGDEKKLNNIDIQALFTSEAGQKRIQEIALSIDKNTATQYENELTALFAIQYGIQSAASLDGKRLNTIFGPLGAEQHLPRFAGDSAAQHTDDPALRSSGITPGRGAWGLWTSSKASLSTAQIEQEKYYIAAQTFLAPGFRENPNELYNWFKYRKILMINPSNGKAVVAVIGDAGPATWTGKNYGGSPEVMKVLEAHDGRGRASVFVYFVDDPENKVPLGPVNSSSSITLTKK